MFCIFNQSTLFYTNVFWRCLRCHQHVASNLSQHRQRHRHARQSHDLTSSTQPAGDCQVLRQQRRVVVAVINARRSQSLLRDSYSILLSVAMSYRLWLTTNQHCTRSEAGLNVDFVNFGFQADRSEAEHEQAINIYA